MKCEHDGCRQIAEFYDPMGNRLCSDCIQSDVETGEYSWDDCEVIPVKDLQPAIQADTPCTHPGCRAGLHVTHPCEVCGRIGGRLT